MAQPEPDWSARVAPTRGLLHAAVQDRRFADASDLLGRLRDEWAEIRFLYPEFLRRTVSELRRRNCDSTAVDGFSAALEKELGANYEADGDQRELDDRLENVAKACESQAASVEDLEALFSFWLSLHDRWRDLLAAAIDLAVELLGEDQLGNLWTKIQEDEIAGYARYDPASRPWRDSFEEIVQSAITGMHGHLCGPKLDGEIEFIDNKDYVELRFKPCGSGGRIRDANKFGVTRGRHDWAWNREGVCYYCAHCCVLQQLTPIDRFGVPVRVINPPTAPGDPCSWKVYRSFEALPDSAYLDVGRDPAAPNRPRTRGRNRRKAAR